ncbi:hypothetical protein CBS147320_11013 [Aspergillus niger]|nr:hypothetical protein CBS133816_3687 [Aspergillus niger]KAI2840395.1 hypothetical protein CBS11350_6971 [Aspergillus niger]KAI2842642.1 hypothetical protein CBS12448_10240 [Aspergillus niger]KAI2907162.1 hypothetical protein CBS147371_10726 [Aspergillus niger]KAI2911915.1 hypothetical protein CBS147320_11013 [Aspergillus niger]
MTEQRAIFTSQAPTPFPVFSQAIVRNDTIYCSGMVGLDIETGALVSGGVASQTDQLLRHLATVLEEAKSGLQKILKVTVYITSMEDFSTMNEVYQKFFSAPLPVRPHNAGLSDDEL